MKSGIKITAAALLCLAMMLCVFPLSALAANVIADGYCGNDDVEWRLTDDGVFTVSGTGDMIGTQWYNYRERIKTVVIENGVTAICGSAFNDCVNLTKVTIPNSVTSIGNSAFNGCTSLKSITIPESVTSIYGYAFSNCTALTGVTIPDSVTSMDNGIFYQCTGLKSVKLPKSINSIGKYTFYMCRSLTGLTIPDGVTSIGEFAFGNSGITSLTLPDSVKTIGNYAFDYSPIADITIPYGVTSIGDSAFFGCESLKDITIPDSVTSIGDYAFGFTRLENVELPKSLTSVNSYMFCSCRSLKSVNIPSGVTSVGEYAFSDCPLLKEITIPGGVTSIGSYAFSACTSLERVSLPEGLTAIPDSAFFGCSSLVDITIPSTVTSIGSYAFYNCLPVADLSIPKAVKSIGQNAFYNITGTVTFSGNAPNNDGTVFCYDGYSFTDSNIIVLYPANDPTWTDSVKKSYGKNIVWVPDNYDTGIVDTPKDRTESLTSAQSRNKDSNNYINMQRWTETVDSHLIKNPDGSFTRVEHIGENIVIEEYDSGFKLRWKKTVAMELPVWGGFYSGSEYNFFVFGQENLNESNSRPVVRVVRYTKNWHRVDYAELSGANTIRPFKSGSLRMTEMDDILHIHTSHQMYKAEDGMNHQANLFMAVSIPYMKVIYANYGVGGTGYVSHSFNQFILADGDRIVRLDHGDGFPRSLRISGFTGAGIDVGTADILRIYGSSGDNDTGVAIGGFEASDTCYLAAGNTVVQNAERYNAFGVRNIFVTATDKSRFAEADGTKFTWITSYKESDGIKVSNPILTKISSSRFLLMWNEADSQLKTITRYMYLDGSGNPASQIYQADYPMSDCQPVVSGGRLIWYVTENSAPKFYSISLTGAPSYEKGDVDMSGQVGNSDLIMVARHVVHILTLTGEQFRLGDMDGDGEISNKDIISLARKIVGLN